MNGFEVLPAGTERLLRACMQALPRCYCPNPRQINGVTVTTDVDTCTKAGKCTCGNDVLLNEECEI